MRSQTFQERRGSPRIKLPPMLASVTATNTTDADNGELHGHAYDISSTGVRIELDHPLELGQTIGVHVEMPWNGRHIDAVADVVWVNDSDDDPGPRRMALHFVSFGNDMDALRLEDLMRVTSTRVAA